MLCLGYFNRTFLVKLHPWCSLLIRPELTIYSLVLFLLIINSWGHTKWCFGPHIIILSWPAEMAALGYAESDTREPSRGTETPTYWQKCCVNPSEVFVDIRRGASLYHADRSSGNRSSCVENPSEELRSLEDLAPLAIQRIEALALEGLKVQSELTEEEAPFSVRPAFVAREGSFRRWTRYNMLEGAAGLSLLEAGSGNEDNDLKVNGNLYGRVDAPRCRGE